MRLVRWVASRGWAALRSRATGLGLAAAALALAATPAALAEQAHDWQLGMQPAASPVRDAIDSLHDELLVIITLITLFVLGLLLYVILRFRASVHPTASQTTHNTLLELLWTTVPILILVIIAIPSFKLLYFVGGTPHADLTLKVTGHQWYWSYEYPDNKDVSFDSAFVETKDLKPGQPRLLTVDNPVVLPVGAKVRILVTSTDVIHSWFVPSMGVQEYAIIGRTNESWMEVERPGTYYGQCNQICGLNHPFMPIEIKGVSKENFEKWVADPKMKFAANGDPLPAQLVADAGRHSPQAQ
ncbi:MAG TPA: cytochrome c oxidase subunit II [Stellaceae bacterium]|nr:cytochrome c oxidase subunit II [Stellaceae bacterium]